MNTKEFLFVEKYRPEEIIECALSSGNTAIFNGILQSSQEEFPNMIFVGPAGVGKTTVAKILANKMGMECMFINASEKNGIDELRTTIKRFASTGSLSKNKKVVILDEGDHLSSAAQHALRGLIEEFSSNCRFIITCNYSNKIIDAIHSRCPLVDFSIPENEKPDIAAKIFERFCSILDKENISYDADTLTEVVLNSFPDFRKMLGRIQQYSRSGNLSPEIVSASKRDSKNFDDLFDILKNRQFKSLREWVTSNKDVDMQVFFSQINEYLGKKFEEDKLPITPQSLAFIITLIAEYNYKSNFIVDNEITMMGFLCTVMAESDFV